MIKTRPQKLLHDMSDHYLLLLLNKCVAFTREQHSKQNKLISQAFILNVTQAAGRYVAS